jgi:peptide deformylase
MIKDILQGKDIFQVAEPATREDLQVGQDLRDTLEANLEHGVGMAANMIGVNKQVIIALDGDQPLVMYNPQILKQSGPYEASEGCMSLVGLGTRTTTRYETIKVQWQNEQFQTRLKTFKGFTAQIIQHEIDHLKGIVI